MIGTVSFECCLVEKISPEKEKWKSTMKRGVTGNCIRLSNEKTLGSHPEKKEIYLKPDFYTASIQMVRAFENPTQGSSLWLICANSVHILMVNRKSVSKCLKVNQIKEQFGHLKPVHKNKSKL